MGAHEKALEAGLEAYNKFECGSDVDHVRSIVAGYLSALLPEDAGSLISELCDAAYRNAGPAGHQSRIEHRAASLIQSQAARIAELEAAIRGLLDCPDIADNDHKDEETHAAERAARAILKGGAQGMSGKSVFGEPEQVEVRLDDDGKPAFFFSSRDGWENLGPEICMSADTYAIGTKITLREPLP